MGKTPEQLSPENTEQRRDLILQHLEPDEHFPSADRVRVKDSGVPVWALVGYYKALVPEKTVTDKIGRIADDYDISRESVSASLEYYGQHKVVFDARLLVNKDHASEKDFKKAKQILQQSFHQPDPIFDQRKH